MANRAVIPTERNQVQVQPEEKVAMQVESTQSAENTISQNGEREPVQGVCVKIRNLHKTYLLGIEGVPALRGVNADIKYGEFVMLLGKSGSGKTTLLNLIGTIDQPTRGELQVCGLQIRSRMEDKVLANLRLQKLGFVFQTFNLIPSMTALENVLLPTILKNGKNNPAAHARGLSLLEKVGMADRVNHYPSQLSGGEQQRVTIARALVNSPSILLLDEPTGDLDSKNTENVMKLLMQLNIQENVTMVMVTHDPNLKYFAHRSFHMMDGRIYNIEEIDKEAREYKIKSLGIKSLTSTGNSESHGNRVDIHVEQENKADHMQTGGQSTMKTFDKRTIEDCKMTVVRDDQYYSKALGNSLLVE